MSSAEVTGTNKGRTYAAQWQAEDPLPGGLISTEMCWSVDSDGNEESGEGHGGGLIADASARAKWDGTRLRPSGKWYEFSYLQRGVTVTQCESWWPQVIGRDGDEVIVRWSPRF